MYKPILASTLVAVLAITPAFAVAAPAPEQGQNPAAATRSPPSPHSNLGPQPLNSLPRSAATATHIKPGADIATTPTAPAGGGPDAASAAR